MSSKWDETFYYDSTSPSHLRWARDSYAGRGYGKLQVAKGDAAGSLNGSGQYEVWANKRLTQVHRIIYEMFYGEIPEGMLVDHIDGNRGNNSPLNLRVVTHQMNARNQKKRNTNKSGVTGVHRQKDSRGFSYWVASWTDVGGKRKSKAFSVKLLGEESAFDAAKNHRSAMIKTLAELGEGWTEDHGIRGGL